MRYGVPGGNSVKCQFAFDYETKLGVITSNIALNTIVFPIYYLKNACVKCPLLRHQIQNP